MRKYLFTSVLLLAVVGVGLTSCNKLKDALKITLNLSNEDAVLTVPALPDTGSITFTPPAVYLNLDSIIKSENSSLGAGNIKEVKITSCTLSLTNGDENNNFSAIESCKIELASNVKSEFVTIGSVSNNPDVTAYTLELASDNNADLKDYFLNANQLTYRFSIKSRKPTTKELTCKIKVNYKMVVGLD